MAKNHKPSKLGDILKKLTKKKILDDAKKEKDKSYDIRKIFQQMELDLISSMHRAFSFHNREQEQEGFSWEQWQLSKLRSIEEYRKRNKKLVDKYNKPIQECIDNELKKSYKKSEKLESKIKKIFGIGLPDDTSEKQKVREEIAKSLGREITVPEDKDFFGMNDKKLEALQKVVENDLKKAQYSVLRKMDDVYRQTIYKTHVYIQSGAKSLYSAIDMATKDFLGKGIDSITYKDGKKVNIASYAEMCLRTASHRATLLGEGKKRDEWGLHLVVVSAHANTCSLCEPWQGKILIDDVFSHGTKEDGPYPLLSEAIRAGLLHPNCRHTLITYFPGITKVPTIPDGKEAIKTYEAEQKQREIERKIRKWKRIEAGTLDPLAEGDALNKVKQLQGELKRHLGQNTQLRRNYEREENMISTNSVGDNGLQNKNKYLNIPEGTVIHANRGDLTEPRNPKKIKLGELRLKKGGHGEAGIELLKETGIEYNIVKEYDNGVRIGNVPNHKVRKKREGTAQAWFPKDWTDKDIEIAARYIANLKDESKYIIVHNKNDNDLISIYKYANYKGITIGVCYDYKVKAITTIFPDENQRMLGRGKSE